jgi:hypothetical protein
MVLTSFRMGGQSATSCEYCSDTPREPQLVAALCHSPDQGILFTRSGDNGNMELWPTVAY